MRARSLTRSLQIAFNKRATNREAKQKVNNKTNTLAHTHIRWVWIVCYGIHWNSLIRKLHLKKIIHVLYSTNWANARLRAKYCRPSTLFQNRKNVYKLYKFDSTPVSDFIQNSFAPAKIYRTHAAIAMRFSPFDSEKFLLSIEWTFGVNSRQINFATFLWWLCQSTKY